MGKSRIAIQVALDIASRFPDGAWLCELATAHDDEELAQVVAATLGVLPRPATTLTDSILDALAHARARRSCSTTASTSSNRWAGSPRASCATARACGSWRPAARRSGSRVSRCGRCTRSSCRRGRRRSRRSLPVPRCSCSSSGHGRCSPAFVLDETNAEAVAEICRRLDGIPLAVELAAARVTIMTPTDIAARLDQRFQLLTGGRRSAAERHQTLRGRDRVVVRDARADRTEAVRRPRRVPGQLRRRRGRCGCHRRGTRSVGRARRRRRARRQVDDPGRRQHRHHPVPDAGDDPNVRSGATRSRAAAPRPLPPSRRALHAVRRGCRRGLAGPDEAAWRERIHLELDNLRVAFVRCSDPGRGRRRAPCAPHGRRPRRSRR